MFAGSQSLPVLSHSLATIYVLACLQHFELKCPQLNTLLHHVVMTAFCWEHTALETYFIPSMAKSSPK